MSISLLGKRVIHTPRKLETLLLGDSISCPQEHGRNRSGAENISK